MSTSDILKAALEKKKQQTKTSAKSKTNAGKSAMGNQVTSNKPAKKSSGRGR